MLAREMLGSEQTVNMLNLVHDEYLESVLAGHEEDYADWAAFAVECIEKIIVPKARHATPHS